jgi:circadian clock protein KaiC
MNETQPVIKLLATGVPGFDEILGGGLPEYSFNLVAGAPGSGKTTLAHQMMFALATPQRPAIYFTVLGEPPLKMLRYQQQFKFFDLDKLNRCIRLVSLAEETASGDLDKVLARIMQEVETHKPGLVFVDSFRSVALANRQHHLDAFESLQAFVQNLGVMLTGWQATTFLVGEYIDEKDSSPIFTIADGVIWMHQSQQDNSVVRKIEITKMRGQATRAGLHTFRMGIEGLKVFPPAQFYGAVDEAEIALPSRGYHKMGIPGLDKMMGGGLPRGYSLLVAGPSGSGKSILAAAFLAEGARSGEKGVIAAFETRPKLSRARLVADLIERGAVSVIDTRATDLSVDEVTTLLIEEIRRTKATRVVIDSLSGFELAVAPTFRSDFRESLARLVAALLTTGASVVMTSELEDRYIDLRFSPYGTAFLTDAIIVQRYIEVGSRFQRMLAVVKVRANDHSNELRLFHIDNDGIHLGEMLVEQEGLLGGSPSRRRA